VLALISGSVPTSLDTGIQKKCGAIFTAPLRVLNKTNFPRLFYINSKQTSLTFFGKLPPPGATPFLFFLIRQINGQLSVLSSQLSSFTAWRCQFLAVIFDHLGSGNLFSNLNLYD
jgi:hypothetical protein